MTEAKKTGERLPNKFEAILPVLTLLGLMFANFYFEWGNDPPYLCTYNRSGMLYYRRKEQGPSQRDYGGRI